MSFAAPASNNPRLQQLDTRLQSAMQNNPMMQRLESNPQWQHIMQLLGGGLGGNPPSGGTGLPPNFGGQQPNYGTPQFGLWGTPSGGNVPNAINSQMPGNVPIRPGVMQAG